MQKLHFVAQGAALAKVMEVSIAVIDGVVSPGAAFGVAARPCVSGAAATSRSRAALAGLSAVAYETADTAETFYAAQREHGCGTAISVLSAAGGLWALLAPFPCRFASIMS